MKGFEDLVERRIRGAMDDGAFDDLPGNGRPLDLDDDRLVPAEMRLAYRVLKNSGFLPEEVALRKEIADVEALLDGVLGADDRQRVDGRLALLRLRLAASRGERPMHLDGVYHERLRRRLAGDGSA